MEGYSVCSFDSWDSWKYVSFESMVYTNVNRLLEFVGINPDSWAVRFHDFMQALPVHAEELVMQEEIGSEAGSSPDNPFNIENLNALYSSTDARKIIYTYYWNHLNFRGHDKEHSGFWISEDIYYGHAHNMFLQVAYDYGIIPGILFVLIYLYSLYRAFLLCRKGNWICMVFLMAILCFGMVEMVLVSGQITVSLMAIMFYFTGRDGYTLQSKTDKVVGKI